MADPRFNCPYFREGWAAWLAGKGPHDNPYRDAVRSDKWEAGRTAAAHEA